MVILYGSKHWFYCKPICRKTLIILFSIVTILIAGCSTKPITQSAPNPEFYRVKFDGKPKSILIFFDGTANNWSSRTNVRKLFELVAVQEDPEVLSFYIDGVGSSSTPITGGAFGYGMKPRILEGYKFLARHYKMGDKVFIFGFSRGALQARSLAGMVSYNGLPEFAKGKDKQSQKDALAQLTSQAEDIWDLTKAERDLFKEEWKNWQTGQPHPFADKMLQHGINSRPATIRFLGLWDTVPGSSFKEYDLYEECDDRKKGDRYKIQPYPVIEEIAHAVSLDEKRSKFRQVLVNKPYDPNRTQLHQVWFPGAHADIGGGYEDSNDLAGLSLNWMLKLLEKHDLFGERLPQVYADPLGLAHWSIGDRPANLGSKEENRSVPSDPDLHSSISDRMNAENVYIRKSKDKIKEYILEKYSGYNWKTEIWQCKMLAR